MRILYLNVNGFFGNEDKKTIINDNNKNINIVRKKQKCGIYHDSSEAVSYTHLTLPTTSRV